MLRPRDQLSRTSPGLAGRAVRARPIPDPDPRLPREGVTVSEPILSTRALNKSFGPVHVLKDVDFDVYPGEVTALVGDNGAGKSTLVKCIAGIYGFDCGKILFEGQPVSISRPARRHRPRHRGRLPGPRARRQPRHHPEHVPRPRAPPRRRLPRRRRDGAAGTQDAGGPLGAHGLLGAPGGRPTSPAASARRWPSPRRCCGTARSSSSTSPPRRSVSPRPGRSSTSYAVLPTRVAASCSSRTT